MADGEKKPTQWNSTLRPGKPLERKTPLKSRPFWKRWKDDPLRYGVVWREVKKLPCWGQSHVPGHACSGRHTAHHDPPVGKRGDDLSGQLPTCEALHAPLENREPVWKGGRGRTRRMLLEEIGMDEAALARLAGVYVRVALERLAERDALPDEVRDEAFCRGYRIGEAA